MVAMNGTYGFVYCGIIGVGMGVLRLSDTDFIGSDLAGGKYRGTILKDETTGAVELAFEMTVPTGVFLVTGTSAQDMPYTKRISTNIPFGFEDGRPFDVDVPPGAVTMMVRRIPDEYAVLADGININITPIAK
jgi:hypothetical protein